MPALDARGTGGFMRPKIICHMVSSIDGRLVSDRWSAPADGVEASSLLQLYETVASRLNADGWLVGRKTMASYVRGTARQSVVAGDGLRTAHIAERKGRSLAITIDPEGKLHYGQDNIGGDHVVAVLGEGVSDDYLAELRTDGVSYILAGADGSDLHAAMNMIGKAFGVKTILLEGGGITNGTFLRAGLIDEISLLVYPGIDGLAGVPSTFEYIGAAGERPATGLALRHLATETLDGGMVWLRYLVQRIPDSR
jgi:5-amino-6-(5-phosphoribosylamino)uracil reductase